MVAVGFIVVDERISEKDPSALNVTEKISSQVIFCFLAFPHGKDGT
ncbi:MAG: hypothetical protein ACJA1W_001608 [Akkermansiaceae bacterium]|jgi:hypothetical protein